MASPITTSGFQVQERPGINYLPASSFTPNYGSIMPAMSAGLGAYGQLQQIADEAQARPIRQKLQQIQLQEAQARLAQLPVEEQLRQIQLGEAQKDAAIPRQIAGDITFEDVVNPADLPALDETGARTGPIPMGDLVKIQNLQRVGPGGVTTPDTIRTVVKTSAEREADAAKQAAALEATRALSDQRSKGKEFETTALIQGYQDALDSGDDQAAALYKSLLDRKSMAPGILPTGTVFGREVEKNAARIGITVEQASQLAATAIGASAMAKLAQQQAVIKSGRSFIPPSLRLTPAEQAAIDGVQGAPAAAPAGRVAPAVESLTPAGDILPRPQTKAERDKLPDGTKYIAPDGKTYIKG